MEVFFKNLSAEDTSTEQLVEDVLGLVAEAENLVNRAEATLGPETKHEIKTALERMKLHCAQIKQRAVAGAESTDRLIRRYPYPSLLISFGLGMVAGLLIPRSRGSQDQEEE